MSDMETLHGLLKYSFAPLNISTYVDEFTENRRRDVSARLMGGPGQVEFYGLAAGDAAERVRGLLDCKPLEGAAPSTTDTELALGHIVCLQAGGTVDEAQDTLLDLFQKRFEVFHRVFDQYDENMRKVGSNYTCPHVYALLSTVLGLRYIRQKNLNDLNTSLKLNDVLMKSGWSMTGTDMAHARVALDLERSNLTSVSDA
jgi:hypothetical protein